MYISTLSPRRSRVEISALFPLTFMRFVLIYLYKSDCGKKRGCLVYEFVKSLRLVVFFDFKAFHCVLLRDFRILLYIGVFYAEFRRMFFGF